MSEPLKDILWDSVKEFLFISKDEYLAQLDGWDIQPVEMNGDLIAITVTKGPQFHIHSMGVARVVTRKMLWDFIGPIVDAHGYAETRTPIDDERQHRFNRAFGFVEAGRTEFDTIFRIERPQMNRNEKPCLS